MKFGLLPAAIAGALLSGNAFAGTEACIEVFKSAANDYQEHNVLYTAASCKFATVGGTTADSLRANDSADIAYELTKNLDLDFEAVDQDDAAETLNIVYVPTSDIPAASRLKFRLNGATFANNSNIIYLVKAEADSATGNTTKYSAVASTDGAVDGENVITFIVTDLIGAGTRLVLSLENQPTLELTTTNVPVLDAEGKQVLDAEGKKVFKKTENRRTFESPAINIANPEVCTPNDKVTLEVIEAKSDFGQDIKGAVTNSAANKLADLVDIQKQFTLLHDAQLTTEALVDAESPSYRGQFVFSKTDAGLWVNQTTEQGLFWESTIQNKISSLDQYVEIDADDRLRVRLNPEGSLGGVMNFAMLYNDTTRANTPLDASQDTDKSSHISTEAQYMHNYTTAGNRWTNVKDTAQEYSYNIYDVVNGEDSARIAMQLEGNGQPMSFNYLLNASLGLEFKDVKLQDDKYCQTKKPFKVGVNGATLKVPHTTNNPANFVRITNEHVTGAEVSVTVFDENSTTAANEITFVLNAENGFSEELGPKDSIVYKSEKIIKKYAELLKAKTGLDALKTSDRVSMTFVVTAPKDTVHATSVIKGPGNTDRVMAVLDNNKWSQ